MCQLEAHILHSINYDISVSEDSYNKMLESLLTNSKSFEETTTSGGNPSSYSEENSRKWQSEKKGRFTRRSRLADAFRLIWHDVKSKF